MEKKKKPFITGKAEIREYDVHAASPSLLMLFGLCPQPSLIPELSPTHTVGCEGAQGVV